MIRESCGTELQSAAAGRGCPFSGEKSSKTAISVNSLRPVRGVVVEERISRGPLLRLGMAVFLISALLEKMLLKWTALPLGAPDRDSL